MLFVRGFAPLFAQGPAPNIQPEAVGLVLAVAGCNLIAALPVILAIQAAILRLACLLTQTPSPTFLRAMLIQLVVLLASIVTGFVVGFGIGIVGVSMSVDLLTILIISQALGIVVGAAVSTAVYMAMMEVSAARGLLLYIV